MKHLAYFGPFRFDLSHYLLWRETTPVDLDPLTAKILAHLIENRGAPVSLHELKEQFWPEKKYAFNRGVIDKQISKIRKALGDLDEKRLFIETKPKLGWQFIAPVTFRTEELVGCSQEISEVIPLIESDGVETHVTPLPVLLPSTASHGRPRLTIAINVILLALIPMAAAILKVMASATDEPRVLAYRRLTWDGRPKSNLFTDGKRIFFSERVGTDSQIMTIPLKGGDPMPFDESLRNLELKDVSRDGSKLLLNSPVNGSNNSWLYSISTKRLERIGDRSFQAGALSPDGHRIAGSAGRDLSIYRDNGTLESRIELPAFKIPVIRWSPSGDIIRFTVSPYWGAEVTPEWEYDIRSHKAHEITWKDNASVDFGSGAWSPHQNYYFVQAGSRHSQDLWVAREATWSRWTNTHKAFPLTNGELGAWYTPLTAPPNNNAVYAINHYERPELVRLDPVSKAWLPMWHSAPALDLSLSPDRQWVVYTHFPDHSIWKARPDGSDAVQLTKSGLEAHQPHWSPDSQHIVYMGQNAKSQWHIFRVPAAGGMAEELPSVEDAGVPTYSPDGRFLIFGERITKKQRMKMSIHILDLATKTISAMPGTEGLWSARWSPDGQYILATTSDMGSLHIRRLPATDWKEVARMKSIDHATWSADSRYIYFTVRTETDHCLLYRIVMPSGRMEQIASLAEFELPQDMWFGVGDDGVPLGFRAAAVDEIYRLDCRLP